MVGQYVDSNCDVDKAHAFVVKVRTGISSIQMPSKWEAALAGAPPQKDELNRLCCGNGVACETKRRINKKSLV